jgi:hypothetical protein
MTLLQDIINAFIFWLNFIYYIIIYSIPIITVIFILSLLISIIYLIKRNMLLENSYKKQSIHDYYSDDESINDDNKKDLFDDKLTEDV